MPLLADLVRLPQPTENLVVQVLEERDPELVIVPPPYRVTFAIRGLSSLRERPKATVTPCSLRRVTAANRTRTMNATRVLAGAYSKGPHAQINSTNRPKRERALWPLHARNFSTL